MIIAGVVRDGTTSRGSAAHPRGYPPRGHGRRDPVQYGPAVASEGGVGAVLRRWALVAAGIALAVPAGCGRSSLANSAGRFEPAHAGALTVATAFLPAAGFWEGEAPDPSGGFERDLAHALADRFDVGSVVVVPVAFGDLVGGDLGGADLALSELTPTDERDEVLDFSTPYLVAPPGVLARPGIEAVDVADLQPLRWVAVAASTLTDVVDDRVRPDDDPLVVDTRTEALQALDDGRADVMLLDLPVALAQAKAAPDRYRVLAQLSGPEGLAAALPDGSDNLQAVDSAIRAFLADGTIERLSKRWLGADLGSAADDVPLIRTEE